MDPPPKNVSFYTLGCKLNFAETSTVARSLLEQGFQRVGFGEKADLCVINTCSVTANADRKCRKIVRQVLRHSPDAFVTIIGCYAQLRPEEIARIPGVDMVLGASEKFSILDYAGVLKKRKSARYHSCDIRDVTTFFPSHSAGERTRGFLKVQDGCDYNCSYCTIPRARGRSRSETVHRTVREATKMANSGVREIVLTGVNIGDFGAGTDESFYDLVQKLDQVEQIDRIRISSIEPNLLTDEIISFMASSKKFLPHLHLPLQSASNKILRLMRRRYLKGLYAEKVARIKSAIPDCCIGADVMVGFPGETEEDLRETYDFVDKLDISYLHVFAYSERPGTHALSIRPVVPEKERVRRSRMLRILSARKRRAFYDQAVGKVLQVLFETYANGLLSGLSGNYVRIRAAGPELLVNEIRDVKLVERLNDHVRGEMLN